MRPFIEDCKELLGKSQVSFKDPSTPADAMRFRREALTLEKCVLLLKKEFSIGYDIKFRKQALVLLANLDNLNPDGQKTTESEAYQAIQRGTRDWKRAWGRMFYLKEQHGDMENPWDKISQAEKEH